MDIAAFFLLQLIVFGLCLRLRHPAIAGIAALAIGVLESAVAALPANVFSVWMNFSGSVLANWWSKRRSAENPERETS